MATAIEAYYVDHNSYPAWAAGDGSANSFAPRDSEAFQWPTFRIHGSPEEDFATLTTPVAYITSYFPDTFSAVVGATFSYWAPPDSSGWILLSPGPDEIFNLTLDLLETVYDPAHVSQPSGLLLAGSGPRGAFTYDPTNGTISAGDLWRVSQ